MARLRVDLNDIFTDLLGSGNVYFQPPANIKMQYPAILYSRDRSLTVFADNSSYRNTKRYLVTVIDPDPDSVIPDKIAKLPMCISDRFYVADNLNHDVFNLYF